MLKNIRKYLAGLIFIFGCIATPGIANADHGAGGEIMYKWLNGDNYRVYFRFFRDCKGIPAELYVSLCYSNSCNSAWDMKLMTRSVNPFSGTGGVSNITPNCPGHLTTCQNPSSVIPGYQEIWYSLDITLPSKCHEWKLQAVIVNRNNSDNLMPNGNLTLVATLNNLNVSDNSSTFFSVPPATFVCEGFPFTYNNGGIDPNGDSLVFDIIQPISGGGCPSVQNPIAFQPASPPYNTINNPFQTLNSFTINGRTGEINFFPFMQGVHTITFRVKEYRGPLLVGSVTRDVQIRCFSCTPPPLTLSLVPTTFINTSLTPNGEVLGCVGKTFTFCYDITTNVTDAVLVATDNHTFFGPSASVAYTGQTTTKIRGCFTFTPTTSDIGLKTLTITVKDSSCKTPNIIHSYTLTIPILINNSSTPPNVVTPVYPCHNEPAIPLTANGVNLLWYTVPTGGMSSTTAITPSTGSIGKTTYYVTQNYNGCESPRMPVVADVQPKVKTDITTSRDSVCFFEDIIFTDVALDTTAIQFSWDIDEGGNIISGDSSRKLTAEWNTYGQKNVVFTARNLGCTTRDTTPVYVIKTPIADWDIQSTACVGRVIEMAPIKEVDAIFKWKIDGQNIYDTLFKPLYKFIWSTTGVKQISLNLSNTLGCSTSKTETITVYESPEAKITDNNGYLCYGKQFTMQTEYNERMRYAWSPRQYFTENGTTKGIGVVEQSGYIYLTVTNTWNCTAVDSVYLFGGPCCEIFMPDAFTPNNDGTNDTYKPVDIDLHTLLKFMIVNRQGRIVFETKNPEDSWDGTHKGTPQDSGTYSYYMKYICADNTEREKKGNFILIR